MSIIAEPRIGSASSLSEAKKRTPGPSNSACMTWPRIASVRTGIPWSPWRSKCVTRPRPHPV